MNNKGVSIIEIISVIIIIMVILILVLPNASEEKEKTNMSKYLEEVHLMVDNAKKMYQNSKYKDNNAYFTCDDLKCYITLDKIENVSDFIDPFGYIYDKSETKVVFYKDNKIRVTVKSCSASLENSVHNCYEIVDVDYNNISENDIKNTVH